EIRQKRPGEPYLSMLLADRSGEVDAKMWDNVAEGMDTFDRDDFVKVKGLFQLYNNRPQFTVHKLRIVEDREGDFGASSPGLRIPTCAVCSTRFSTTRKLLCVTGLLRRPKPFTMHSAAACWNM